MRISSFSAGFVVAACALSAAVLPAQAAATTPVAQASTSGQPDLGAVAPVSVERTGGASAALDGGSVFNLDASSGSTTITSATKVPLEISLPLQADPSSSVKTEEGTIGIDGLPSTGVSTEVIPLKDGRVSIQTTLETALSDTDISYEIGDDLVPYLTADGGVDLITADGVGLVVGHIEKPWAFDAGGVPVATSYTIDGNSLTQNINPTPKTTFPVLADPTYGHTYGIPTAYLNKSESRKVGTVGGAASVCGVVGVFFGPAGAVCGLNVGVIATNSPKIVAKNQCVKLLLSPVSVIPTGYTGGNCK